MKIPTLIQPRYIIAIAVTVALIMVTTAYIELNQSRDELFHLMEKEGFSLAESIEQSSVNVILSTDQIEKHINERLFNNAYFIARLDSEGQISKRELKRLCFDNNIFRIDFFNRHGKCILSSNYIQPSYSNSLENNSIYKTLQPILSGEVDKLIIGTTESQSEQEQRYAVAIKRTNTTGGAIMLSLNIDSLTELRRSIGIGKLMKDLGNNKGVEYVLLQDELGIIAASGFVEEMSSIESDGFLKLAFSNDTTVTRTINDKNKMIYEVVRPLLVNKETIGIIRVGLAMDEIQAMEARMERRVMIISLVLIVLGALALIAIVANQNIRISQKKIQTMETFTGNILERMQDAIVTLDTESKITIFNKQAEILFGIEASQVLNRSIYDTDLDKHACLQTIFSSNMHNSEITILCPDRPERTISIAITNLDSNETAVIRDLTETKRLQQEIEHKNKLSIMGELSASVAHEIRNPLNAISMIAQRYEKEFKPKRGVKEYKTITSILLTEIRRVNHIIQQFLRFARPPKLKLSEISVEQFANHISKLFENQTKLKGIRFTSRIDYTGPVCFDKEQMTQALLNILQNALDATPKGGSISLHIKQNKKSVLFEITDNGSGIPTDRIKKIFDLYYTTKHNGTGMGLAITQQIINQHNGVIEVQSQPGIGTTFLIQIPLNDKSIS
jgi:PAS domain S-box-containing protein